MSRVRPFKQVDVFTDSAYSGNPVAVVFDADDLSTDDMQSFARWTNLSETTFLIRPSSSEADYGLRIFTPGGELPFAGHPTLGSAHAWLEAGGTSVGSTDLVQECGIGLVHIARGDRRLSFQAPAMLKTGPLEDELVTRIAQALRIEPAAVVDHQWVDNGPGWAAVKLASADQVLAIEQDKTALANLSVGVVGPYPDGSPQQFEVRGFFGDATGSFEDPVTGSLNASLAQWLIGSGQAPLSYIATQGRRLGHLGRIFIEQRGGQVWVGGSTVTCIDGTVEL